RGKNGGCVANRSVRRDGDSPNSDHANDPWGVLPVHPHACGEQPTTNSANWPMRGSSPRVWGTVSERSRVALARRFIPTRVGNRALEEAWNLLTTVHPHACGE